MAEFAADALGHLQTIMAALVRSGADELNANCEALIDFTHGLERCEPDQAETLVECLFRAMRRARRLRRDDLNILLRMAKAAVAVAVRFGADCLLEGRARERLGLILETGGNFVVAAAQFELVVSLYEIDLLTELTPMPMVALCSNLASARQYERLRLWALRLLEATKESEHVGFACTACSFLEQCEISKHDWLSALHWIEQQRLLFPKGRSLSLRKRDLAEMDRRAQEYLQKLGASRDDPDDPDRG